MKALWTLNGGLQVIGQHIPNNPRRWTVTAWAMTPDGTKERVNVRPNGKCTLHPIIELMNKALSDFEREMGVATVNAGFMAVAR